MAGSTMAGRIAAFVCIVPVMLALAAAGLNGELRQGLLGALPLMLRFAATLLLPAVLLWAAARAFGRRLPVATAVLLVMSVAFIAYAGLAQSAALLLMLAVSTVIGSFANGSRADAAGRPLASLLVGLALIVSLVGWLLPLPVHSPAVYLPLAAVALVLGWARLVDAARASASAWSQAVASAPWAAAFAVCIAGFASMLTWMPSLNPDDNSVHLLLARQLIDESYARLDVSSQIFVVAPWFNNALNALLSVLQGGEARSAVGLWWLAAGCLGAYRLTRALGADGSFPWLAAALYASHPLTAYFGMTLQVDGASAALLLLLVEACIHLKNGDAGARSPWLTGALCGALVALKITNAVYVAMIGLWLCWHLLATRRHADLAKLLAIASFVAFSSYFYATVITGNPLFPLFNGVFKSPYAAAVDFSDQRWHVGVGFGSPWDLTFATSRYMEAYAGAAGLSLIALLGAWGVSLGQGRVAWLTLLGLLAGLVVFHQVQYLRYVFPAIALLGTVGVVVFSRLPGRQMGIAAIAILAVAQCGLIRTTSWIVTAGAAEQMLREGPRALPRIERTFVPERSLVRRLDSAGTDYCLLFAEPMTSYAALAPARSLVRGFYDQGMNSLANAASADPSGKAWSALLERIGFTHVEFRPGQAPQGLVPALESLGFAPAETEGEAQIWSKPGASPSRCLDGTIKARNEARRLVPLGP